MRFRHVERLQASFFLRNFFHDVFWDTISVIFSFKPIFKNYIEKMILSDFS